VSTSTRQHQTHPWPPPAIFALHRHVGPHLHLLPLPLLSLFGASGTFDSFLKMCQDGATLFNHLCNIFVVFLIVLSSVCRSSFAGSRWGRYNVWSRWIKHMEVPSSIEESCSKAWWSGDLNTQCGFLPVLSNLWWARSEIASLLQILLWRIADTCSSVCCMES
jgi:hypothetical protein